MHDSENPAVLPQTLSLETQKCYLPEEVLQSYQNPYQSHSTPQHHPWWLSPSQSLPELLQASLPTSLKADLQGYHSAELFQNEETALSLQEIIESQSLGTAQAVAYEILSEEAETHSQAAKVPDECQGKGVLEESKAVLG